MASFEWFDKVCLQDNLCSPLDDDQTSCNWIAPFQAPRHTNEEFGNDEDTWFIQTRALNQSRTYRGQLLVYIHGFLSWVLGHKTANETSTIAYWIVALSMGSLFIPASSFIHITISANQETNDKDFRDDFNENKLKNIFFGILF